jgi:hypothetical protein
MALKRRDAAANKNFSLGASVSNWPPLPIRFAGKGRHDQPPDTEDSHPDHDPSRGRLFDVDPHR